MTNVVDLADFPARIARLIDGVYDKKAAASRGEWAIFENVCHLREIEADGYAVRIEQLMHEDDPLFRDVNVEELANDRRDADDDCDRALHAFAETRARSISLLQNADERAFEREGRFENAGRVTLAKIVSMMREHDEGHYRDIAVLA